MAGTVAKVPAPRSAAWLGQLLFERERLGEQVAAVFDPFEDVGRLEDQRLTVGPAATSSQSMGVDAVGRSSARSE